MRAELRALVRVEPALEQISHDAGLDELPVGFAGDGELADFFFRQLEDGGVFEEVPVEVTNLVRPEGAAFRHGAEQILQHLCEVRGIVHAILEDVGGDAFRKQAGVLREKTEDNAIKKPGDAEVLLLRHRQLAAGAGVEKFGRFTLLKGTRHFADLLGQLFGDFVGGALRLEEVGIIEDSAQEPKISGLVDVRVAEFVGLLDGAGEIRADDVAIEIANDEQWRIEERFAVPEKLLVSGIEVLLLAFIFPGETTALPDIGKAALGLRLFSGAAGFLDSEKLEIFNYALLKAERFGAGWISGRGCRMASNAHRSVKCSW
jgi:hypothetical protein